MYAMTNSRVSLQSKTRIFEEHTMFKSLSKSCRTRVNKSSASRNSCQDLSACSYWAPLTSMNERSPSGVMKLSLSRAVTLSRGPTFSFPPSGGQWRAQTTTSSLPRIAQPSLWTSLIPKALKDSTPSPSSPPLPKKSRSAEQVSAIVYHHHLHAGWLQRHSHRTLEAGSCKLLEEDGMHRSVSYRR